MTVSRARKFRRRKHNRRQAGQVSPGSLLPPHPQGRWGPFDRGTAYRRRVGTGAWGKLAPTGRHIPRRRQVGKPRRTINRVRARRDTRGRFR